MCLGVINFSFQEHILGLTVVSKPQRFHHKNVSLTDRLLRDGSKGINVPQFILLKESSKGLNATYGRMPL